MTGQQLTDGDDDEGREKVMVVVLKIMNPAPESNPPLVFQDCHSHL